jgi:hypothetical protein
MSAPRPPDVRRAYNEEARLVLQLTSLSTLGPPWVLYALGFRFARITLAPLNHIAPTSESSSTRLRSNGWAQRRRQAAVSCNTKRTSIRTIIDARGSARRAHKVVNYTFCYKHYYPIN